MPSVKFPQTIPLKQGKLFNNLKKNLNNILTKVESNS